MKNRNGIVPVPVLTLRRSTYWVQFVTDVPDDVVRSVVNGLRNEATAADDAIRQQLPVSLTPWHVAFERALDGDDGGTSGARVAAKLDDATTRPSP